MELRRLAKEDFRFHTDKDLETCMNMIVLPCKAIPFIHSIINISMRWQSTTFPGVVRKANQTPRG